jgi:hypothetical protein
MSTQHTPGPWKTNGDPYVSTADGKRSIAFCDTRHGHEDRANARLIAAAPELLEALKVFCSLGRADSSTDWNVAFNEGAKAIAKATGEIK